ncbi:hypothetical protein SH449x_004078 [Pirellulaceae bacterium SH449]
MNNATTLATNDQAIHAQQCALASGVVVEQPSTPSIKLAKLAKVLRLRRSCKCQPATVVIVELIRSDIDNDPVRLKPGVGLRSRIAQHILRWVVPKLAKMVGHQVTGIPTASHGESVEMATQSFRVALLNQSSELGGDFVQFCYVTLHDDGGLYITKTRPRNVEVSI